MNEKYYPAYYDGDIREFSSSELWAYKQDEGLWSGRLSTGLLGLTNCEPGNKGPKGKGEILLGIGVEGLRQLVDWGFIPCPICTPENPKFEADRRWNFLYIIQNNIKKKYGFSNPRDFCDKSKLPFDARRLNWEEIIPVLDATPSRIYLPKGLKEEELKDLETRFNCIGFILPPVGFYDKNILGHFNQYIF